MKRSTRITIAAVIAIVAWAGMTGGEILIKCRVPGSEGCIWAKAFFPELTVPLYGVLVGLPTFGLAYWLTAWWSRHNDDVSHPG